MDFYFFSTDDWLDELVTQLGSQEIKFGKKKFNHNSDILIEIAINNPVIFNGYYGIDPLWFELVNDMRVQFIFNLHSKLGAIYSDTNQCSIIDNSYIVNWTLTLWLQLVSTSNVIFSHNAASMA